MVSLQFEEVALIVREFYMTDVLPLFGDALKNPDFHSQIPQVKDGNELVGFLDTKIEDAYRRFLNATFPEHSMVGEEGSGSWPPSTEGVAWIVDPLDGTHNILSALPIYGSMCALIVDGQVEMSFIFRPIEEMLTGQGFFACARGYGSWSYSTLSRRKLSVSTTKQLSSAFVVFEGPSRHLARSPYVSTVRRRCRRFRNGLSVAVAAIGVADGGNNARGCDAVISYKNKPWDNLPLALFVEEAGGKVTDLSGHKWSVSNYRSIICSNRHIHPELVALQRRSHKSRVKQSSKAQK